MTSPLAKSPRKTVQTPIPVHQTIRVGVCLAFVGGFLDAYTYILRGGVFANAQTGNVVLLGVELARGNLHCLYYTMPILAFLLGVLASEWIKHRFQNKTMLKWQHAILLVEAALLLCVAFVPQGVANAAVNITVSLVCSLQVNTFRNLHGLTYATTMCTGNLRSAGEQVFRWLFNKDVQAAIAAAKYFLILACFIFGAVVGTLLCGILAEKAVLVCCAALLVPFALLTGDSSSMLKKQK